MRYLKNLLADLGFIMQFSGIFVVFSALLGLYLAEDRAAIAFFLTASCFLVLGFLLNALAQRKGLTKRQAYILLLLTFLVVPLIGSLPFLYLQVFGGLSVSSFVKSFFEASSGITTTGLSLIENTESLPKSLIFYRSLLQFLGGLGIVFIMLTFVFSSEAKSVLRISKILGLEERLSHIKRSFAEILIIYLTLTLISAILLYLSGLKDGIISISLVMSLISTGGFLPVSSLGAILSRVPSYLLCLPMLLGAISFRIYIKLRDLDKRKITEVGLYLLLIGMAVFLLTFVSSFNFETAFFHAVTASTTTGFYFLNLSSIPSFSKFLLVILMFIGGMAGSTAGGIKFQRILEIIRSTPILLKNCITERQQSVNTLPFLLLFSYLSLLVFLTLLFSSLGNALSDSLMEAVSIISNTGYSAGIIHSAPDWTKLISSFAMILGRVEIIPLLLLFVKEEENSGHK